MSIVSRLFCRIEKIIGRNRQKIKKSWPKTVDDAVQILLVNLSEEDKETIQNTPPEKLAMFHHGLGTYIRNQFGLWQGNKALVPSDLVWKPHPDAVSMYIIRKLHTALNPGQQDFSHSIDNIPYETRLLLDEIKKQINNV